MTKYSNVTVPVVPSLVVRTSLTAFGSYTSKSGGKLIFGASINFRFPVPLNTILYVNASFAFSESAEMDVVMESLPTVPLNPNGFPSSGRLLTVTFTGSLLVITRTLR